MKAFLAHINTKAELTVYLSDKITNHYQNQRVKVLVMHHTAMESNHPLSEVVSVPALSTGKHNLEEGDQLVILNALDVMHTNQQSILDVFSVDTDVLLMVHFSLIPQSTTLIRRGGDRIRIKESYMEFGRKRAEALLGWYAFKQYCYLKYVLKIRIEMNFSITLDTKERFDTGL